MNHQSQLVGVDAGHKKHSAPMPETHILAFNLCMFQSMYVLFTEK